MASLLLKNFPTDIRNHLLKLQMEHKVEKGIGQYSLESVIYKIIRAQPDFEGKNKK